MRRIDRTYTDPLSLIWVHAAAQLGMRIERSAEVNASWDGRGVLTIGAPETLDPDDSLAQMILHEVCHALCEGPDCLNKPDWGLESFDSAGRFHEYACLRLQAALADLYDNRSFFAATTMFRSYYDRLPADPLQDEAIRGGAMEGSESAAEDLQAIALANVAWERAHHGPWAVPLHDALRRTAEIAHALHGVTTSDSIWHRDDMTRLADTGGSALGVRTRFSPDIIREHRWPR